MQRAKRPVLASVLAFSFLFAGWAPAAHGFEPFSDRPGEVAMIADTLLARPVLIASTLVGVGIFTIAIPFSLLGGNVSESAESLVLAPGRSAFIRCLGCTPAQHEQRQSERLIEQANR
jgi:hypothetical protein